MLRGSVYIFKNKKTTLDFFHNTKEGQDSKCWRDSSCYKDIKTASFFFFFFFFSVADEDPVVGGLIWIPTLPNS
jgi:hypothetical protein